MSHVLIFMISFGAFFIQSALGFGSAVILVVLGSLCFPLETLLPAFIPVSLLLSFGVAWGERSAIQWTCLIRRMGPWLLLGLPVGMWVFTCIPGRVLQALFGVFVFVLAVRELRATVSNERVERYGKRRGGWVVRGALVVGGVIQGALGAGGPVIVYAAERLLPGAKDKLRATLCALWVGTGAMLTLQYGIAGRYSAQHVPIGLSMLLAVPPAMWLGVRASKALSPRSFRICVYGGLSCMAVVSIVSAWFSA